MSFRFSISKEQKASFYGTMAANFIALLFAPFSIWLGFSLNDWLARPVLSSEFSTYISTTTVGARHEIDEILSGVSNYHQLPGHLKLVTPKSDEEYRIVWSEKSRLSNKISSLRDEVLSSIDFIRRAIDEESLETHSEDLTRIGLSLSEFNFVAGNTERIKFLLDGKQRVLSAYYDALGTIMERVDGYSECKAFVRVLIRNKGGTTGSVKSEGELHDREGNRHRAWMTTGPRFSRQQGGIAVNVQNTDDFGSVDNSIVTVGTAAANAVSEFWFTTETKFAKHICESPEKALSIVIFDGQDDEI